jgi:hypothetical protein
MRAIDDDAADRDLAAEARLQRGGDAQRDQVGETRGAEIEPSAADHQEKKEGDGAPTSQRGSPRGRALTLTQIW